MPGPFLNHKISFTFPNGLSIFGWINYLTKEFFFTNSIRCIIWEGPHIITLRLIHPELPLLIFFLLMNEMDFASKVWGNYGGVLLTIDLGHKE